MRISICRKTCIAIIRIKYFLTNDKIFHIIVQIKVVLRKRHLCMEGHLKLRLQSLKFLFWLKENQLIVVPTFSRKGETWMLELNGEMLQFTMQLLGVAGKFWGTYFINIKIYIYKYIYNFNSSARRCSWNLKNSKLV